MHSKPSINFQCKLDSLNRMSCLTVESFNVLGTENAKYKLFSRRSTLTMKSNQIANNS